MIEVSVRKDNIEVIGHAGQSEPGHDIVCAGVSALIQTLAASIDSLTDDDLDCMLAPGVFILKTKDLSAESRLLVDSFFVGICGVAEAHPDYIKIV